MRIDGITCCTGDYYANLLKESIDVWSDTLDTVTIVCKPEDEAVQKLADENVKVVTTDVFTKFGAQLNKGAALNHAYAQANPKDWVLHFDADIMPPADWCRLAEDHIFPGSLYGAPRKLDGVKKSDCAKLSWPFGYFQLWHSRDPVTWRWPVFDTWYPHCGSYDANFAELWDRKKGCKPLPFMVHHTGQIRKNWFGYGNSEMMEPLTKIGLMRYRQQTKKGFHALPIPRPALKFRLKSENISWIMEILRICRGFGPWLTNVRVSKAAIAGYIMLDEKFCPAEVLSMIERVSHE